MKTLVKYKGATLKVQENYLSENECDMLIQHIHTVNLDADLKFELYGKTCTMHRCIGFFSDTHKGYAYSNDLRTANPLTEPLKMLLERVNSYLDTKFNGLLINLYRDGNDFISPHSDKEVELSKDGTVVALSLGVSRIFRVRHKDGLDRYDFQTNNGQLLIMGQGFQDHFTHEIPVQKRVKEERISITFRQHVY